MVQWHKNSIASGALALFCLVGAALSSENDDMYPEKAEIAEILSGSKPEGVLFLIMEHDEEALKWVLPRILEYTRMLRGGWANLPISVLSHGEEMMALVDEYKVLYPQTHSALKQLIDQYEVLFHVCGAYASMSDYGPEDFPDYVDVVPFGPAEIENYRMLEFAIVNVELTW